jgi:hypothetical protein
MCPQMVCQPHCDSAADQSCRAGSRCLPDGHCQIIPCDDPEGMPCYEHFRCDPAAAPNEPVSIDGSDVNSGYEDPKEIARGCVRKRCDEPDGHVCLPNWECTPVTATDASGCYPVPCMESGQCLDEDHICEPTSENPRPEGTDFFGCVFKNCDEGYSCSRIVEGVDIGICDFDSPVADPHGCASRPCDDETPCSWGICDPSAPKANVLGCRALSCPEEVTCGTGQTCVTDPEDPEHGSCSYSPATGGSAGMTGTAGAGNVGSSGEGGAATSGGTGGVTASGGTGGQGTGGGTSGTGGGGAQGGSVSGGGGSMNGAVGGTADGCGVD